MLYLLMKQKDMIHRLKITVPMLPLVYQLQVNPVKKLEDTWKCKMRIQHRFLDLPTGGMVMAFIHSLNSLFCCGIEPLAQIGFRVQGAKQGFRVLLPTSQNQY